MKATEQWHIDAADPFHFRQIKCQYCCQYYDDIMSGDRKLGECCIGWASALNVLSKAALKGGRQW